MSDGPPTADELPVPAPVRSHRLVATLAVAGALAGLLLVLAHQATAPAIRRNQAAAMERALGEVLPGIVSTRALFVEDGVIVEEAPAGADELLATLWLGTDAEGRTVGYGLVAGAPGFQDVIKLIFGYDPAGDRILGMRVLESKETPGLGDKIEKDEDFVVQFTEAVLPLLGVKPGRGTDDPHEIDTITGATISSDAVIRIINEEFESLRPLIQAHASREVTG